MTTQLPSKDQLPHAMPSSESPVTQQEIVSAIHHHAAEIARLTETWPSREFKYALEEFAERADAWHKVFEAMQRHNPGFSTSAKSGLCAVLGELERLYTTPEPPAEPDTGRYCVEVAHCERNADFHIWDGHCNTATPKDAEQLQAHLNRAGQPPPAVLPDHFIDVHAVCDERDRLRTELSTLKADLEFLGKTPLAYLNKRTGKPTKADPDFPPAPADNWIPLYGAPQSYSAQPPGARPCTHRFTIDGIRNPRPDDKCDGCGETWGNVQAALTKPVSRNLVDYGYAPGNYMSTCLTCEQTMTDVDKRCRTCKSCAEKRMATALGEESGR
jgi:hypothetical protein